LSKGRKGQATILIVDDDETIREALGDLLTLNGFSVMTAPNGEEALALLRSTPTVPCAILLDLLMPVMDGWGFLEQRGADPKLRRIAVGVMSGLASQPSAIPGVQVMLKKPMELPAVMEFISDARRRAEAPHDG
jgi:CheY-like chemotaxis protein